MKLDSKHIKLQPSERFAKLNIPIIGLSGGIATGKTAVSDYLKKDHPLICADQLVKQVYTLKESFDFIDTHFPECIDRSPSPKINFKKLRETFFADKFFQQKIETFIYPQLPKLFLEALNHFSNPEYVFFDVPLLFEKSYAPLCDLSLLIYAPRSLQKSRLIERDKISSELADKILDAQWDIEKKKELSSFVIENTDSLESLYKRTQGFIDNYFN